MSANPPMKPASGVYAQGVESVNRCLRNGTNSEVSIIDQANWRAGLTAATIQKFWSKVQLGKGCWLWTGSTIGRPTHRYGQFNAGRFRDGKQDTRYAHRVAYELTHGPVPDGLVVRHKCDVCLCVRPSHLELGTQGDNIRDAFQRGRQATVRPGRWKLAPDVRRRVLHEALRGRRGTIARLAREHGVSIPYISVMVKRHRENPKPLAVPAGNPHA